ncbi:MAG TPA: hemerythrin domain-containing protein [Planctomycetota bacterium]|jgi:hemerythrin-like domain-containing protein|nr:hemerythrin domain-containing protein [Planctomycetota bacterium]
MKRHEAFKDLSRDHMFALRCAHHIDQAVRNVVNGPSLEDACEALLKSWDNDILWHFREEEDVILPILSRHFAIADDPDFARMLNDHCWLRDGVERLRSTMCNPDSGLAGEVARRLHDHVRLEERVLFPRIEGLLCAAELAEIEAKSAKFRRTWRGEDVVGPFRTRG